MYRIPDLDTGTPPAKQGAETSHTCFPSQCNGHRQHHEQELSKKLPNEEHFRSAPSISLPALEVQPCLILAVGSQLRVAPTSPLEHQQCPGEPETSHDGAGEQQKHGAKGRSCKLEIPFSPTNKNQEHFTTHSHIHHPGMPVQLLGLSCTCPPQDSDPPPAIMASAKSPSFKTSHPLSPTLTALKSVVLPQTSSFRTLDQRGFSLEFAEARVLQGSQPPCMESLHRSEPTAAIQVC